MGHHFLSPKVLRDFETGKRLLRQMQIEDTRHAWRASVLGFFVRLIFFGSLGILLLGLALLQES